VIGIQSGTSSEAMAEAIREGSLEELLVYAKVQAGDVLYMPANTVHAVGPDILLYEVQQSSDVTYRLYDWNRMGLDGKPRELHIEKGVQVSNLESLPKVTHSDSDLLVDGDYFQTWRYQGDNTIEHNTEGKFHSITCIEGQATIQSENLSKGQTMLIPASYGTYGLELRGTVFLSHMK
jgi:mannose-6-phosphate isomerase